MSSLQAVRDMTWKEFVLRRYGWQKEDRKTAKYVQMVAYYAGMYPGFDPKKTKMSDIMEIDGDKKAPKVSDKAKELFKRKMKEYNGR